MRVCFLTTSYPRFTGDVAGTFIARLAQALHEKGVAVRVVAPNDGRSLPHNLVGDIPVYRFHYFLRNYQRLAYGDGGIPANLVSNPILLLQIPFFLLCFLYKTWSVARDCDLLHVHWGHNSIIGLPVSHLSGKPLVVTLWGSDLQWMEKRGWLSSLMRLVLSKVEKIISLTDDTQGQLKNWRVAQGRTCVIPNGVDTNLFHPRDKLALRKELSLPPERIVLLYVGSLIPRKGLPVLLDAIHLMKAAQEQTLLILIGEGRDRLSLEERTSRLGLSQTIRFIGAVNPGQIPFWMAAADLFILPSFYEGVPNVLLEAMASGLPIVATDIPGNRNAVKAGETGLLIPSRDAHALSTALDEMILDGELRTKMGSAARSLILERGLTWEECALKHVELYKQILLNH